MEKSKHFEAQDLTKSHALIMHPRKTTSFTENSNLENNEANDQETPRPERHEHDGRSGELFPQEHDAKQCSSRLCQTLVAVHLVICKSALFGSGSPD
jgi:hypothetical protein